MKQHSWITFLLGAFSGAALTWLFTSSKGKKILNNAKQQGEELKSKIVEEINAVLNQTQKE